jgi:hypothetical protein
MSTSRRRGFGLNKQAMVCIIHVVLVLFSSNFTNSREYLIAYRQSLHDLVVVVAAVKNGTATTKNNGTSTADNTITDAASTGTKEIAP